MATGKARATGPSVSPRAIHRSACCENARSDDRVVSRLDSGGRLYVSANHWPRAWYERALANPEVRATVDGEIRDYRAVSVTGAEHDRVQGEHPHAVAFRIVTGFPPRRFLRLDPR